MLCMVAAISAVATSCKDDDDDAEDAQLVGTWHWSENGEWGEYTFNSNGTYTYDEYGGYTESGTYTYNHPTLTLEYDGEKEVYVVKSISDSKLVLEDEEGDPITYRKGGANGSDNGNDEENSDNSQLVGTWRDSYDGDWDEYTFNSNGTYTWVSYENGKGQDTETGTYTYNHPTLTLKCDGDTMVYTVKSISSTKLVLSSEEGEETYTKK